MTTFEQQWETEELNALQQRLQREYPGWQRRSQVRRTALASVAVVAIAGVSIFNFQFSIPKNYDRVVCNRSGIADSHWTDVASHVLTAQTL